MTAARRKDPSAAAPRKKAKARVARSRKRLTGSQEDYLETVLLLVQEGHVARVRDIAARMEVSMPSVTAALKTLSARGLVNYDPYQVITLTDEGTRLGEEIHRRHRVLRGFLADVLALDEADAEEYACRIEHAIDATFLHRLDQFVAFIQTDPANGETWLARFRQFCADDAGAAPAAPARKAPVRARRRRRT